MRWHELVARERKIIFGKRQGCCRVGSKNVGGRKESVRTALNEI